MRYEPSRLSGARTLRFRLMVWNAAVVIVTALVTLLGLREGVRLTLIGELDQLLAEDIREIELALAGVDSPHSTALQAQLDRKDAGHAQHKWFVQLLDNHRDSTASDANGDVAHNRPIVYQSQHAPRLLAHVAPEGQAARTVERWRFIDSNSNFAHIRVGSSLELIDADVRRIDRIVAMAVGAVLLLAPLGGYWLAGRATQPLNAMIETMSDLRPAQLDERLSIRGTGDELDRLSLTFNALLDRIGSYLQEHREVLANAAHELRTPLAAIRSSIEVALERQRTDQQYQSLLEEIIQQSSGLELLVNQLLLLSETEAEGLKYPTQRIRLDESIERAVDMFSALAECRGLELRFFKDSAVEIDGNPQHIRQVLYNLLDNAVKFTQPGGSIIATLQRDQHQAIFEIQDTGLGVSPEDLPRLFDRFFRGHSDRREQELRPPNKTDDEGVTEPEKIRRGTGLGLSICRAIVRAHHGTIAVDSRVGQGTKFTVRLPLADVYTP